MLCYHASIMKQTTLEPGLLQFLRLYVALAALVMPILWRLYSPLLGSGMSLLQFVQPTFSVLLFLVFYTSFPWWQQKMGRAFLPTALILLAAQAIFGNYLILQGLVSPAQQQLALLTFMLRLWVTFQVLVMFVAWQYDLFWTFVSSITLCLLDAVLAFPFMYASGPFYSVYVMIVTARLLSVTAVGLGLAWLMKRQREHRAALAEANRKLTLYAATTEQLAVSQERNRMARELHDTLAHSLSGVIVQLEAAEALWDVNLAGARKMVEQVHQSARSGLTEVRRALNSLRASSLEDLGLALAISDLAESVAARTDMQLNLEVADHIENIPPEVEQCMYRVAQEALANVARHSKATSLHVSLTRPDGHLILSIQDDGQGFDSNNVDNTRYGLKGLRERAEMIGGTLNIETKLHHGTTVQFAVPLLEVGT